jgi:asparagine synthase (glutamine-hydrolysing)
MHAVNEKKYKVCLLGTAADELFAGYYDHYLLQLHDIKNNKLLLKKHTLDFDKHIKKFIRNPNLKNANKYIKNPNDTDHIFDDRNVLEKFLLKKTKKNYIELKETKSLLRNRMLNELFKEITPVILNQDDLNSMYFSVENRSPFLDKKLVEFAFTIPSKFLIKDGFNKYILRNAFKNIVSKKILKDRKKIGFNASVNTIFDLKSKNMRKVLLDKKSPIFKYVKRDEIKKLVNKDYFSNSISKFFFNFINAKIFLEQNK